MRALLQCLVTRSLEIAGAPKPSAMGLQGEPATTPCRCSDVGFRTMPGAASDRTNHSFLVGALRVPIGRVVVIFRVIPIGDPLSDIARHVLHPIGGISSGQRPDHMEGVLILPFTIKVRVFPSRRL